ncbi:Rhodanese domain-containing protein [Rhodotorula toruloides]|nr:Rhodanese domain-containing protein [Rhodotorula toruloides]
MAGPVAYRTGLYAAFPAPKANLANGSLAAISCAELRAFQMQQSDALEMRTFLVVDVRRADFEDAYIAGAINLPAQSFYQTLPALLPLLTPYNTVIFHCSSSKGRGPRCAGWYEDALEVAGLQNQSRGAVLTGGIVAWKEQYAREKDAVVWL